MMSLFDQAKAMEQYGYEQRTEGFEEGALEIQKKTALKMKKKGLPINTIADFLDVSSNTVRQWLSKTEPVQ